MDNTRPSPWVLERVVIGGVTRLNVGTTTIGRSVTCTITVSSDFVSRTHAEFHVEPSTGDVQVRDLGSTNGIFVNDAVYNSTICRLKAGDRIGIGVTVDDDQVSPDGKYPMFILRRLPLVENNEKLQEAAQDVEVVDVEIIPASPSPSDETDIQDDQYVTDSEYDEDDDIDDFVDPQGRNIIEIGNCITDPPPPSTATLDASAKSIIVSQNIQSIFGDLNPELLSSLSKDVREIAEASTSKPIPPAEVENIICISSDEECSVNLPESSKSPELFGDFFNNDEDVINPEKKSDVAFVQPSKNLPIIKPSAKEPIALDPVATSSKAGNVDENEEDDIYFTQRLLDDMREELPDPDVEVASDYKVDEQGSVIVEPIKRERLLQSEDDVIDLDGDDDEYDEVLESKVKDWSIKLFSQSFSNSFNASQVYEDDVDNAHATITEEIFINLDDYEEENERAEPVIKMEKDIEPQKKLSLITPSSSDKEGVPDSPLVHKSKQRTRSVLFTSSSSEEDNQEEEGVYVPQLTKSSLPSQKQKQEAQSRIQTTADEIPKKKRRLSKKSDENEKVSGLQRKSSSSFKHYSRDKSERRGSRSTKHKQEDLFDNFKKDEKQISRSSERNKQTSERRLESKDTSAYRRSSSTVDENTSKHYKSATVARRKSLGNISFLEEKEGDDFEQTKKPEPTHTTQTKTIRGPPEIITPPQLPVNRGKLRGISAAQQRCMQSIKALECQKDLRRKWIEKPSVAHRKDQEKCKAIKEDRKQKLKELADKKKSDALKSKNKASTKENDNEKAATKKPKVKNTSVNRGAFLTEAGPSGNKKPYKIPKAKTNLARSSSTTESTSTSKPSYSNSDERKTSTEPSTSFCTELSKADAVLQKSIVPACRNRQKSTDTITEKKSRAPPRRATNKLTFDSMIYHINETSRLQDKQEKLAKASSMKSPIAKQKIKKTVRFNDVPEIHYIEPLLNVTRKIDKKEPSTFNQRKNAIRGRFPLVDHTDDLVRDVLIWSQLWLQNKRSGFSMDGSDDIVYPMTNQFSTIEQYKNTLFPLLKGEYLSHLERDMEQTSLKRGFDIRIDYIAPHKDRELVSAKCLSPIKPSELGITDLALIDFIIGSTTNQCFGYVGNIRKGVSCNCIFIEVCQNVIPKDKLKKVTKVTIRRVIENIRVYFGSFNAVHQLEQTPLFQKILNPLDLLNVKTQRRPPIQYKGCDVLNDEQKEILLKTYAKAIEEYNPSITLIEGPPGTGKSRIITNLVLQLLYGNEVRRLDKKILVCAQSNTAVDIIARQLLAIRKRIIEPSPKYKVIRFGKEDKIHKDVRDITVHKLIQRDQKARLLERSNSHEHTSMGENLQNEILKEEAKIAELKRKNSQDSSQDEIIKLQKSLTLKKHVLNQTLRPEDEKRLFRLYLENADIICTTLGSCVKLAHYVSYFDVCIIDEATQCTEPWTIMPLKFGVNSLVMVGDTQQLPATIISQKAKDYGLGMSLFTRIQNCLESTNNTECKPILSLHTQYRMHPEICSWPNMYFYKNQLINSPNTAEFKSQIKPFSILNLEYRQNDHCLNGQIANSLEAEFVAKLVKTLNEYIPNKFFSYGIITPYAQHREKLEVNIRSTGLQNIMINTIDSYQGIEKDVIIISNARTNGIGFLANYQRLNVALTRPKKCLILCGNFKQLESVPSWSSLLANARERQLYHDISIADALDIEKNVIDKIKIKR